jgi:ADP-ribosylglycohydrolase/predicted enzyme related to lactoylglutathione lyase
MESDQRDRVTDATLPLRAKAEAAIIAAAVGDALGWPDEGRATRSSRESRVPADKGRFISWTRRAGGRFYAHEEQINRGEYSDDTQLIVATARSLSAEDWYRTFSETELPFWTAYERGGGGATKRAADAWLSGRTPWTSAPPDRRRYFEAGGNGVVMRILPHCIWDAESTTFSVTADSIVKNGICTHGHPRALVGALAYGFATWHQLRSIETLGYGAMVDMLLDSSRVWSAFPESLRDVGEWLTNADIALEGSYRDLWVKTVEELVAMLKTAKAGMSKGALAVDQEVLSALGCFDKRVSGSGTIAAAAAIFLASRYAADPLNGLREAAYSRGADTDTLASLVGGLLGVVNGLEWLGPLAAEVQDSEYLRSIARRLCERGSGNGPKRDRITESQLSKFLHGLSDLKPEDTLKLPLSEQAKVVSVSRQPVGSGKTDQVVVFCRMSSGQTVYLKTFLKNQGSAANQQLPKEFETVKVERVVVRLRVRDLDQAKRFYVGALGMQITKETPGLITLGGVLALSSREVSRDQQSLQFAAVESQPMHVYVETKDLESAFRNIRNTKGKRLSDIALRDGRRSFTCNDPDGNLIAVLEPRP